MNTPGRYVGYDLVTGDAEAAREFYAAVLGWNDGTPAPYTLSEARDGGTPHWIARVGVDDVDDAVRRAERMGAHVRAPAADVGGTGRLAVLTDPQGVPFAMLSPEGEATLPDLGAPGSVAWHELQTESHESAWRFYSELFGWKHERTYDMGPFGPYLIFGYANEPGSEGLGGMFDIMDTPGAPPVWRFYFLVSNLEAALQRVSERGGQLLHGPSPVPGGGRIAQCADPQGALFGLTSAT